MRGSFQFSVRFVQGFDPYTVLYLNLYTVAAVSDSDDIIDSELNWLLARARSSERYVRRLRQSARGASGRGSEAAAILTSPTTGTNEGALHLRVTPES